MKCSRLLLLCDHVHPVSSETRSSGPHEILTPGSPCPQPTGNCPSTLRLRGTSCKGSYSIGVLGDWFLPWHIVLMLYPYLWRMSELFFQTEKYSIMWMGHISVHPLMGPRVALPFGCCEAGCTDASLGPLVSILWSTYWKWGCWIFYGESILCSRTAIWFSTAAVPV